MRVLEDRTGARWAGGMREEGFAPGEGGAASGSGASEVSVAVEGGVACCVFDLDDAFAPVVDEPAFTLVEEEPDFAPVEEEPASTTVVEELVVEEAAFAPVEEEADFARIEGWVGCSAVDFDDAFAPVEVGVDYGDDQHTKRKQRQHRLTIPLSVRLCLAMCLSSVSASF